MRDRKEVDLHGRGVGEESRRETSLRIYYVRIKYISIKGKEQSSQVFSVSFLCINEETIGTFNFFLLVV